MSASEQEAYWAALTGDGSYYSGLSHDPGTTGSPAAPTIRNAGCEGVAQFEVRGVPTGAGGPGGASHQELWAELSRRRKAVELDPRMVEKVAAWSDCMADRGFTELPERGRIAVELSMAWEELHGARVTPDGEGWQSEYPYGPVDPSAAEVEEFKEQEIAMAVADFDCADGIDALRQELTSEMETAFVEEHAAELEQISLELNGGT